MDKKLIIFSVLILLIGGTIFAQEMITIEKEKELKMSPNGETITKLSKNTKSEVLDTKGKWKKVQITGWVDTSKEEKADKVIAQYSGNGIKSTRPFSVDGSWEVQWEASGQVFQIYLYTQSGRMAGVLANQQGAGTGSSYQPKSGKYYLKINAMGNWNVKIINVD